MNQPGATREAAVRELWDEIFRHEDTNEGHDCIEADVRALIDVEVAAERDAHAEVVRALVEAVKDAPHTRFCGYQNNGWECDCYRRHLALALAPFMTTEEAAHQ